MSKEKYTKHLNDLMRKIIDEDKNEKMIQSYLHGLLNHPDFDNKIPKKNLNKEYNYWILEEYDKKGKRPDIHSTPFRTIIETKTKGILYTGKKEETKAKDQLKGYLETESKDNSSDAREWLGILTDGKHWIVYEYEKRTQQLKHINKHDSILNYPEKTLSFISEIVFDRWIGARPLLEPNADNILKDFKFLYHKTSELINEVWDQQFYITKLTIWGNLLSGSGILKNKKVNQHDPFIKKMFFQHSFIVSVARLIIAFMDNNKNLDKEEIEDYLGDGFHTWLLELDSGKSILLELADQIKMYDWGISVQDVLKKVYHGLIDAKDRKDFGEFYTPDYLAKNIVKEVLDNPWLDDQIERAYTLIKGECSKEEAEAKKKNLGVLDPSCGSGTFLFHCADRINDHIRSNHKEKVYEISKIICMLVHGIDIHPIAVEMSKATLRMKLDDKIDSFDYRVGLGNSINKNIYNWKDEIHTAKEDENIEIDPDLFQHPDFRTIAKEINDELLHGSEKKEYNLTPDIKKHINHFRASLKIIIESQKNHIWTWHITNRLNLIDIHQNKVSRIVGNPPWLMYNKITDVSRREIIKKIAVHENVYPNADFNLAVPFTAMVTRLYLSVDGKYGWVLPDGAVKGQNWEKWRKGSWTDTEAHHEEIWDLSDVQPPIFQQSKSCVVLGKKYPPLKMI